MDGLIDTESNLEEAIKLPCSPTFLLIPGTVGLLKKEQDYVMYTNHAASFSSFAKSNLVASEGSEMADQSW